MSITPTTATASAVPLTHCEQMKSKIADLQAALQKQLPGYEGLLHVIHKELLNDEELTHMITEEELGVICQGLQKKTGIVISTAAVKSKTTAAGGKKLSSLNLDDL